MLKIVLKGRYLDEKVSLKRWIDYIHSFWKTKDEKAKKRPKEPKIVKNRSFSRISLRMANKNQPHY